MIDKIKAVYGLAKLSKRFGKVIGNKNVEKILRKRKGLGKTRAAKMGDYAAKKPKSTIRRVKRINKALDIAPYAAVASAAFGTGAVISSRKKNKKKS